MTSSQPLLRLLLLVPPALLLYAGVVQLIQAPYDWRPERPSHFAVSYWVISLSALIAAAPAVSAGLVGFWSIWRQTRTKFGLLHWSLIAGLLPVVLAAVMGLELAGNATRIFDEGIGFGRSNYGAVLMNTIFCVLVMGTCAWGGMFVYCRGISSEAGARFNKRRDEPDAMASIIESMKKADC